MVVLASHFTFGNCPHLQTGRHIHYLNVYAYKNDRLGYSAYRGFPYDSFGLSLVAIMSVA
jgi:hypothetical protein